MTGRLRNLPYVLAALLLGPGAVWLCYEGANDNDSKSLTFPMGALLFIVSLGVLCAAPAVRESRSTEVRWLREMPMGCLTSVATFLLMDLLVYCLIETVPDSFRTLVVGTMILFIPLLVGIASVIRRTRRPPP